MKNDSSVERYEKLELDASRFRGDGDSGFVSMANVSGSVCSTDLVTLTEIGRRALPMVHGRIFLIDECKD